MYVILCVLLNYYHVNLFLDIIFLSYFYLTLFVLLFLFVFLLSFVVNYPKSKYYCLIYLTSMLPSLISFLVILSLLAIPFPSCLPIMILNFLNNIFLVNKVTSQHGSCFWTFKLFLFSFFNQFPTAECR